MSSKSLARSAGSAGQRSGEFVAVAIAVGSDAWCWAVVGWGGVVCGGGQRWTVRAVVALMVAAVKVPVQGIRR